MRFYTYAVIITGIIMLLNLGGFVTPVTGGLLNWFGMIDGTSIALDNFKSSTGFGLLEILLVTSVGAGAVIGLFGRAPDVRYITAGIIFAITSALVVDMLAIFAAINLYSDFGGIFRTIFNLIMGAGLVGLFITAIQFWQTPD